MNITPPLGCAVFCSASAGKLGWFMMHILFRLLFWSGVVISFLGAIAAPMAYVYHWRRGARLMASQALIAAMLSALCLAVLWLFYEYST